MLSIEAKVNYFQVLRNVILAFVILDDIDVFKPISSLTFEKKVPLVVWSITLDFGIPSELLQSERPHVF